MPSKKCPDCGARRFYVKENYDIFEFDLTEEGVIQFVEEDDSAPKIVDETKTYCDRCTWHGKFSTLK